MKTGWVTHRSKWISTQFNAGFHFGIWSFILLSFKVGHDLSAAWIVYMRSKPDVCCINRVRDTLTTINDSPSLRCLRGLPSAPFSPSLFSGLRSSRFVLKGCSPHPPPPPPTVFLLLLAAADESEKRKSLIAEYTFLVFSICRWRIALKVAGVTYVTCRGMSRELSSFSTNLCLKQLLYCGHN
jgi:hypothetical protein